MAQQKDDQKQLIIEAVLEAFKELPVGAVSYFHKAKEISRDYS
tara:strand:- start:208 stop:336 length:129 start_codon:yes stop_codon:yes gene_type:complete